LKNNSKENLLYCIFIISTVATLGSLYFSEIMNFDPCKLCWFQRIFMYPLPILTAIAIIKKDYQQSVSFLFISSIGLMFSMYHNIIKLLPTDYKGACGQISCTIDYFNFMGFITIPFLSFFAFLLIELLLIYMVIKEKSMNKTL